MMNQAYYITSLCAVSLLLLFSTQAVFAQTGIEGQVVEAETQDPLPGATVMVEETEEGTSTDATGHFEFTGMDAGSYTLSVSFVGYDPVSETVDVTDGQMTEVNLEMGEAEAALDELVVTGYSVQPRREVTGAISSVSGEDFRTRAIQTADQALQGSSAGLQLVGSTGQPGGASFVRIRGTGSINAGNAPLYIVDGTPIESSYRPTQGSTNILASINPSDIESIEVLRDAEATAIYGAQGSNGVVLITTRRGSEGATQFNLQTQFGVADLPNRYDLMEGPEWVEFTMEAYANRYEDLGLGREAGEQQAIDNFGHPDEVGSYDWQEEFLRGALQRRVDLSASGGTDDTQFYLSGGYSNNEGTIIGSGFERMNARANFDHQVTDQLSFEANVNLSRAKTEGITPSTGNFVAHPFHGGVTIRTTTPIYNEDGTWNQDGLTGVMYNVAQVLREEERIGNTLQAIGGFSAMYQFTSTLSLRSHFGLDHRTVRSRRFDNPSIPRYEQLWGGRVIENTRQVNNWNTSHVMNYYETFDDVHNVRGLVGTEYRQMYREGHQSVGEQLPSPLFNTLNMTAEATGATGAQSEYRQLGFFSRAQYNYDQTYFVSANLRTDGHSRFGADRRWGLFYSGALAWDIAQEGFMQDADYLNELKPRISYGITGNSSIGNFASRSLFGSGGSYEGAPGLRPTQLGNSLLTWEEAHSMDLAMDFALFDHRIFGSVGVFRTDNEELLLEEWLPSDSGFGDIMENVGTVRTEGLELEFGAVLLDVGNFSWTSELNTTFLRSEVLELATDQDWMSDPSTDASRIIIGEPRHQWWVRNYAGVNPSDGRALFFDEDGELTYSVGSSDYIAAGSMEPDSYGGLNNNFTLGPVSLDIFFQFEFGSQILDEQYSNFHLAPHRNRTLSPDMWRRWTEPGQMTDIPKAYSQSAFPGGTGHNLWSDRRLFDGSYIRLKNINLAYQLPSAWAEQLFLDRMSIFGQAENLLTWTSYPGLDPEVFDRGQTMYPQARTVTVGVDVAF